MTEKKLSRAYRLLTFTGNPDRRVAGLVRAASWSENIGKTA